MKNKKYYPRVILRSSLIEQMTCVRLLLTAHEMCASMVVTFLFGFPSVTSYLIVVLRSAWQTSFSDQNAITSIWLSRADFPGSFTSTFGRFRSKSMLIGIIMFNAGFIDRTKNDITSVVPAL